MRIDLRETAEILKNSDNILLLCHAHPDGDTLGSATAIPAVVAVEHSRREVTGKALVTLVVALVSALRAVYFHVP